MKRLFFKWIACFLAMVMMFTTSVVAFAAPSRNKGSVKYLSEVILLEAKDFAEAKKITEELKASGTTYDAVVDMNLNKGGDQGIFLAYKTSTNVDDAITDLSVMNMNGDFSMGSYEQVYEKSLEGYIAIANDYRVMAKEFKMNYDAKDPNALAAYRQMNYYFVEQNNTKTNMGDYFLNFPETSDGFAEILFRGNLNIITNLRSLMAMGIGGETPLADRMTEAYALDLAQPDLYRLAEYDEVAEILLEVLVDMKKNLNNLPGEIEEIKIADISEEERESLLQQKETELERDEAFYELLCEVEVGESTLGEIIMETPVLTNDLLYPAIGAATQGEMLMIKYRSLYELLLYSELSLMGLDLDEALQEIEEDYEPISVFFGVQNDLIDGTVAVTGDAELLSATTGKNFLGDYELFDNILKSSAMALIGVGGGALIYAGATYFSLAKAAIDANQAALAKAVEAAKLKLTTYTNMVNARAWEAINMARGSEYLFNEFAKDIPMYMNLTSKAKTELDIANAALKAAEGNTSLSVGQIAAGSLIIALGVACMAVSIYGIIAINSKYEPKYTDIPDNMVDVVSNDTFGDRFINYNNAKAYYYKDGKLSTRENDLNAYDGNQWVSLYYTKNYEAGKCLTATADLIAEESVRSGYSPIHLFGRSSNYNLNSFCGREGAEDVYLAFKYSNNKKSAETEIPDIIGSSFNTGAIAIAAVAGIVVGFGIGMLVTKIRKKKAVPAAE